MKYHSMIPELTISDIEITKDFYLNKLGFTLEYEREEDNLFFYRIMEVNLCLSRYTKKVGI